MTTQPGGRAPLLFIITLVVTLFTMVPIIISVMAGVVENYNVGLSSGLTLRWLQEVWTVYGGTVGASIGVALACVLCTLVLGVPCAYALARSKSRWARAFEE